MQDEKVWVEARVMHVSGIPEGLFERHRPLIDGCCPWHSVSPFRSAKQD